MDKESAQKSDENQIQIKFPEEAYPGICNLCDCRQHSSDVCPFSLDFYHATNFSSLPSIAQNNLHPHKGRLGMGIYVSDDTQMCLRFILKNRSKFSEPILLKIKAMVTEIKTLNTYEEFKNIDREQFRKQGFQCIKCPYFKINEKILNEYCLYRCEFAVVGWSRVKFPQQKSMLQEKNPKKAEQSQKMELQTPKNQKQNKKDKKQQENNQQNQGQMPKIKKKKYIKKIKSEKKISSNV